MTAQFDIPDASCGHCKGAIEAAVASLQGVTGIDFDLTSKRLHVEHGGSVSVDALSAAIRNAGYTPDRVA